MLKVCAKFGGQITFGEVGTKKYRSELIYTVHKKKILLYPAHPMLFGDVILQTL